MHHYVKAYLNHLVCFQHDLLREIERKEKINKRIVNKLKGEKMLLR